MEGAIFTWLSCVSQSNFLGERSHCNPSRLLGQELHKTFMSGAPTESKKQFLSFMDRDRSNSVSRHLRPIVSQYSIPSFCLCRLCLPHSLSQETLASAKVCSVLEQRDCPERSTVTPPVGTAYNPESCIGADACEAGLCKGVTTQGGLNWARGFLDSL